jgi:WhiB family transcriptional regulator, redox-sensing transcriptional regulator
MPSSPVLLLGYHLATGQDRTFPPPGWPVDKPPMSGSGTLPDTVTCPAYGQDPGPGSVLISPAAALPAAAPALAPGALHERPVMPSSEFSGGAHGWMPRGACRGEDPELFFPINVVGPALVQVFAAKAVCFRCAVRAACLSFALATGQAGIWGGTTQEERHAMRRSADFPAREHNPSLGTSRAATDHRSNYAGQ